MHSMKHRPSRGVLAGLPHTAEKGFQTGAPGQEGPGIDIHRDIHDYIDISIDHHRLYRYP